MQIHVDMTEDDYPGNIQDVDKESNEDNSELKDKKSAVRAARLYLDMVVNQINIHGALQKFFHPVLLKGLAKN
jgi:hypothetical protein